MTGHTPGPWQVETWRDGKLSIGREGEDVIAWVDEPDAPANARLIAAAPALFEALRVITAHTDAYLEFEVAPERKVGLEILKQARAALALVERG